MKIIAYSKVPPAVPFLHLGYLSASTVTTKPIQGLFLSGLILLVAGVSLGGKWLWQRRKSTKLTEEANGPHTPRRVRIGFALLVPAVLVLCSAYLFGEKNRTYLDPPGATRYSIGELKVYVVPLGYPRAGEPYTAVLPTQEGEYDLSTAVDLPANTRRFLDDYRRFSDGWNTPFRLRVTLKDGELKYTIVSAGPDRTVGTPDDIASPITRQD